jgi:hypothetical protein
MNSVSVSNMIVSIGMQRLKRDVVIAVLLSVLLAPGKVASQDIAVGSADAMVLTAISINSPQGLDFGNVQQGVPKSVASNNSSAAIFEITGASQSGINLYLQLPQYMTHTSGSDRLTILFGPTDASVDTTSAGDPTDPSISGWLNTDPYDLPSDVIIGGSGTDLYLGGKIVPSPNQTPGNYEAEIVLTVNYNSL